MSFYYNYTGPYAGTVNANRANTAKAKDPHNPWLASPPKEQAPAQPPAPHYANNHFIYYPRYDQYSAPPAQTKPAEQVNPWLASPPEAVKASTPHAHNPLYLLAAHPAQPTPAYQTQAPLYYAGHPQAEPTRMWYGSTKAEVDAQNAALAPTVGATKPMELVPASPTPSQQFYVRELNGAYTLRTMTDIETSCQPGSWYRAQTGYPYFVRRAA